MKKNFTKKDVMDKLVLSTERHFTKKPTGN